MIVQHRSRVYLAFLFLLFCCSCPVLLFAQNNSSSFEKTNQTIGPEYKPIYFSYRDYNLFAERVSRVSVTSIKNLSNLQDFEDSQQSIEELQTVTAEFISDKKTLLKQPQQKPRELLLLKSNIQQHESSAEKIEKLIGNDLNRLSSWQDEWIAIEKEFTQWQEHQSQGNLSAISPDELAGLRHEINLKQKTISDRIGDLLEQSRMIREIKTGLFRLSIDVNELLRADLLSGPRRTSMPLFTSGFWRQFDAMLWQDTIDSLAGFVQLQGQNLRKSYTTVLLVLITVITLAIILRRAALKLRTCPELAVFREQSFASAIFLTILCTWYFSILFSSTQPQNHGLIAFVLMLAAMRLIKSLFLNKTLRLFLERSIIFLALTSFLQMVNLPPPIMRVFLFCTIVIGMVYCYFLAYQIYKDRSGSGSPAAPILMGSISLIVLILIIIGSDEIAVHALILLVTTCIFAVSAWILYKLFCCLFDIAILLIPIKIVRDNGIKITSYFRPVLVFFCTIVFSTFILPRWHIFPSESEAIAAILAPKWEIGNITFSPHLVVEIILILYFAVLSTKAIKGILRQKILPNYGIDAGVQFSIVRLVNYFVSLVVFIVLLSVLGIELTKLTIFGSALGIGVGFGLQAVVNNFVSGLILLFERPIKIGDTVQINNDIGIVQNVGLRSTVIQTFDNSEIVVPNSDLVTGQVVNWSLTEKQVRLDVPVGVSYESDVDQVLEILKECGYDHPLVMSQPPPKSLFLGFGDNSFKFELRVWLNNYTERFDVLSELNREIEFEFSQRGIVIPFPQRDLHVKSISQSLPNVVLREQSEDKGNT